MRPSLAELFLGFWWVGVSGFGGVLPFARRMMVERRGWLDAAGFSDTMALAQLLPGPNVTNLAVIFGARHHGAVGALAAITGLIAAPLAIVLTIAAVLDRAGEQPVVARAVLGLGCAGAGLVLATVARMVLSLARRPNGRKLGLTVAGVTCLATALGTPLLVALAAAVPLSAWLHAIVAPRRA